jgi:DNA-directed RNA polymerase delta subunit
MNDDIKDIILSAFEASLEAQLRAIRRLRQGQTEEAQPHPKKGRSQVDMAYDILKRARAPLHVSEIIDRIQTQFDVAVDRESLVSSLSKKVARQDRFLRPEKNTFALRPEAR